MNNTQELVLTTIGQALDNLGNSYVTFLNSANKKEKIQMLWQIRMAAIDVHKITHKVLEQLTGKLIGPDPKISIVLSDAVKRVTTGSYGNLHQLILNLDQLAKIFVTESLGDTRTVEEKTQEKIQYLYQIYAVSADIAECALITSAEPDKRTERA